MPTLKKRSETLASLLLILSGIFGLIIAIADFIGWADKITEKQSISLVLVMVGMLAIALGLERAIRFKDLDEQLNRFEKLFASQLNCRYYEGHNEVYDIAIDLCATAQKHVRTLIIGRTAPEEWTRAISSKLRESKEVNKPIKFQATVAVNLSSINVKFIEVLEERLKIYRKDGVDHLANIRVLSLNLTLGFDLLIVDHEHVFIGIPSPADEQFLSRAIVFENQSKLASELIDWYDQVVIRSAITLDELKKSVYKEEIQLPDNNK